MSGSPAGHLATLYKERGYMMIFSERFEEALGNIDLIHKKANELTASHGLDAGKIALEKLNVTAKDGDFDEALQWLFVLEYLNGKTSQPH